MLPYRKTLQTLGAVALLALALACSGKSSSATSSTTAVLSGNVTYTRVPLATNASGVPTGLVDSTVAANLKTLPAQGALVRFYQKVDQTLSDGSKTQVWVLVNSASTDTSGNYTATLTLGRPTMVEVLSTFGGGNNQRINLVAEPAGIASTTAAANRLRYALRKAADGSAPAGNNTPASVFSATATVNFTVGLNDAWWLVDPEVNVSNAQVTNLGTAVLETSVSGRTTGQGTGSRVLAIGDSITSFVTLYGSATPGGTVDLHYWPGRSEARGSYIEFNRSLYPAAWDASAGATHYFGTLKGGPSNDDAYDEGVIFPLLGRAALYGANLGRTFSFARNPVLPVSTDLGNLVPDMARIEGLAEAMAAHLLKSPYLADTQGTSVASVKDIRTFSPGGPYSAPAIRALTWELILKANSLPSPGTATDWAKIDTLALARFFSAPSGNTNGATDSTGRDIEPINLYTQLARLQEGKASAEPVDLSAVFTNATLAGILAPFGVTWPRPSTGEFAVFMRDWGTDPTGTLARFGFSMSKAVQVNGAYPNLSVGEVAYAGFSLTADKRCVLAVAVSPALPSGASVEVEVPLMSRTFTFTGSGGDTGTITIPCYITAPAFHPVRVRVLSPGTTVPDTTVTLSFSAAS